MIIPKIGSIYEYDGKQFAVLAQKHLFYVYVLEYASNRGSVLKSFDWFKFAIHAKYVGEMKPKNSAY